VERYLKAEGVLNNVLGSLYTARAALKAGIENFVLISTEQSCSAYQCNGQYKALGRPGDGHSPEYHDTS